MAQRFIRPDGWPAPKGFAYGVLTDERELHLGGLVGWDEEQVFARGGFLGQMEQALRNIVTVVEAAGGTTSDLTRLTWYVTSKTEYMARREEVGAAYRRVLDRHFPAMTMVVVGALVEDEALLEIEATAILSDG